MKLYKDISTLVSEGIDYQINIVVQNETVDRLVKNLTFIRSLGARQINLLPVSYVGWSTKSLVSFRVGLAEVALQIEK